MLIAMQVVAPVGFTFQKTCGYWVLSRAGSAYQGLPPGKASFATRIYESRRLRCIDLLASEYIAVSAL